MGFRWVSAGAVFFLLLDLFSIHHSWALATSASQSAYLKVNASAQSSRPIPATMFGIFFEEINHAGAGGLWAELVSNRGFEYGGLSTPSFIGPWSIVGNESSVVLSTDLSSCFNRNKVALKMEILCGDESDSNICPEGGVGVYNPGYWGMNIVQGKTYKVVMHIRSMESVDMSVSFTSSNGLTPLATGKIIAAASEYSDWTKVELLLESNGTDHNARLQLTSLKKGVIWFDQVSAMPLDTYKGHGFRKELFAMLQDLKPQFLRFPGGSYAEGTFLRNSFRWKETVGPWEERSGHFNDFWNYWTDDGLGYFEFLQLAEDLESLPLWVINSGLSDKEAVATSAITPFVQDVLDGIEFARGAPDSKWGSVRAAMGHTEPFNLSHIAVGNQNCGKQHYRGNYLKFYYAVKDAYPDIKIVSNCDGTFHQLDHPADYFDCHVYINNAKGMFEAYNYFDRAVRNNGGPKVFVSEYTTHGTDAGRGNLLAALAEAAFLIGLELNSDVVEMASYAPLFINDNSYSWKKDAIVFNSWQQYGTPSYWMQQFFKESSGASLLNVSVQPKFPIPLVASAVRWWNSVDNSYYLRIKIVNFGNNTVNLKISTSGLESNYISSSGSKRIVLTSKNMQDENSFKDPKKVAPIQEALTNAGPNMDTFLLPNSLTAYDLLLVPAIKTISESSTSTS